MLRLVEDAGEPLSAGWLARFVRETGSERGELCVGDRDVDWELNGDAVNVSHNSAQRPARTIRYGVRLTFTELPSGGARWWWKCPACRERVGDLYLLLDRDRLACRKCCGLVYASQYGQKRRRRKRWPAVVVTYELRTWTQAAGWVVTRRTVRQ